jgi:hypothetical protein
MEPVPTNPLQEKPAVTWIEPSHTQAADAYIQDLQELGFDVQRLNGVGKVKTWLETTKRPPAAIVMEIMIQCPPELSTWLGVAGENSSKTLGRLLMPKILKQFPGVPLMVLTDHFGAVHGFPSEIPLLKKYLTSPLQLADALRGRISRPADGH